LHRQLAVEMKMGQGGWESPFHDFKCLVAASFKDQSQSTRLPLSMASTRQLSKS